MDLDALCLAGVAHSVSLSDESNYDEDNWLSNTQELVAKEKLQPRYFVSWAAYRASQSSLSSFKPAIISLLPIHSKHSFLGHDSTLYARGQVCCRTSQSLITLDEPLFALAKHLLSSANRNSSCLGDCT